MNSVCSNPSRGSLLRTAILLVAAFLLFPANALNAATFTVNTNSDEFDTPSGANVSLREALRDAAAAAGADTVNFAPALNGQTLVLASQIEMNMNNVGDVTVDATSLADGITVSGGGVCRIFSLNRSTATHGAVTLVRLRLTGGNGVGGSVSGIGGAIYIVNATVTLERCSLTGHSTNVGGAIANNGGGLTLSRCTLSGNSANSQGGAVHHAGTGSLTALRCTFSANTASDGGGALLNGGAASVTQCTFAGNTSNNGGAVANQTSSTLELTHCTVSGNTATASGGGVSNSLAALTLTNCIVARNTAASGMDISNSGSTPFGPATVTRVGTNIVQSHLNTGNLATDSGPPAISASPRLAPLADYGGPTLTMALRPGSPARDTATASTFSAFSTITSDQRDSDTVGTPDVGSYEAGSPDISYQAAVYEGVDNPTDYDWDDPVPDAEHDPDTDSDGDGADNEDEWVMGSDITGAVFGNAEGAVSALTQLSTLAGIMMTAAITRRYAGRIYRLEESETLLPGSWTFVPNLNPIFGTNGSGEWQVPIPNDDSRFYRLHITKE